MSWGKTLLGVLHVYFFCCISQVSTWQQTHLPVGWYIAKPCHFVLLFLSVMLSASSNFPMSLFQISSGFTPPGVFVPAPVQTVFSGCSGSGSGVTLLMLCPG